MSHRPDERLGVAPAVDMSAKHKVLSHNPFSAMGSSSQAVHVVPSHPRMTPPAPTLTPAAAAFGGVGVTPLHAVPTAMMTHPHANTAPLRSTPMATHRGLSAASTDTTPSVGSGLRRSSYLSHLLKREPPEFLKARPRSDSPFSSLCPRVTGSGVTSARQSRTSSVDLHDGIAQTVAQSSQPPPPPSQQPQHQQPTLTVLLHSDVSTPHEGKGNCSLLSLASAQPEAPRVDMTPCVNLPLPISTQTGLQMPPSAVSASVGCTSETLLPSQSFPMNCSETAASLATPAEGRQGSLGGAPLQEMQPDISLPRPGATIRPFAVEELVPHVQETVVPSLQLNALGMRPPPRPGGGLNTPRGGERGLRRLYASPFIPAAEVAEESPAPFPPSRLGSHAPHSPDEGAMEVKLTKGDSPNGTVLATTSAFGVSGGYLPREMTASPLPIVPPGMNAPANHASFGSSISQIQQGPPVQPGPKPSFGETHPHAYPPAHASGAGMITPPAQTLVHTQDQQLPLHQHPQQYQEQQDKPPPPPASVPQALLVPMGRQQEQLPLPSFSETHPGERIFEKSIGEEQMRSTTHSFHDEQTKSSMQPFCASQTAPPIKYFPHDAYHQGHQPQSYAFGESNGKPPMNPLVDTAGRMLDRAAHPQRNTAANPFVDSSPDVKTANHSSTEVRKGLAVNPFASKTLPPPPQPIKTHTETNSVPAPAVSTTTTTAAAAATASFMDSNRTQNAKRRSVRAPCFVLCTATGHVVAVFNKPSSAPLQHSSSLSSPPTHSVSRAVITSRPLFDVLSSQVGKSGPGATHIATLRAAAATVTTTVTTTPTTTTTEGKEIKADLIDVLRRMPDVAPLLRDILAFMLQEPQPDWRTVGHKTLIAMLAAAAREAPAVRENARYPLNQQNVLPQTDAAAGLREVQLQLSAGEREAAVDTALKHRLYSHAIIIAMMCPKKDHYMNAIRAVVEGELNPHSPLAHAYCLFNELPLPPFATPSLPLKSSEGDIKNTSEEDYPLRLSWMQQAAILVANFTKESAEGLIQLGDALVEESMIDEAHCCYLLAHLSPMGTRQPGRPLLPKQQHVMELLRTRLGVLGGRYHPSRSRSAFVSPKSTLLTDILQSIRHKLESRIPPPGEQEQEQQYHGLPPCPNRYKAAFRYMQVMWMHEVGMHAEAEALMTIVAQAVPPPSPEVQQFTLNRLVAYQSTFLFGCRSPLRPPNERNEAQQAPSMPVEQASAQPHQTVRPPLPPPQGSGHAAHHAPPMSKSTSSTDPGSHPPPPPLPPPKQPQPQQQQQQRLEEQEPKEDESQKRSHSAVPLGVGAPPQPPLPPPTPQQQQQQALQPPPPSSPSRSSVPQGNVSSSSSSTPLLAGGPPPPLPPRSSLPLGRGPNPQQSAQAQTQKQPAAAKVEQNGNHPLPSGISTPKPSIFTPNSSGGRSAEAIAALKPPSQHKPPPLPPPAMEAPTSSDPVGDAGNATKAAGNEAKSSTQRTRGRATESQPQSSRRSRSLEAITNFLFRRGQSQEPKKDEAKKMIIDTEKPPKFDPATGRYLFDETEEEKKVAEMIKAGPPPPSAMKAPVSAAASGSGPPPSMLRPPGPAARPGSAPRPRAQYVDMFNT